MNKLVVDFSKEATVFINAEGELVERLAMNINGRDVQILRFDGNDNSILVKVDTSMNIMPKQQVDGFIKARL